jgi:hypothetical protein
MNVDEARILKIERFNSYNELFNGISDFDRQVGLSPFHLAQYVIECFLMIKLSSLEVSKYLLLSEPLR